MLGVSVLVPEEKLNYTEDEDVFNDELFLEEDYSNLGESLDVSEYNVQTVPHEICLHVNTSSINGSEVCSECGVNLYNDLSLEPEWRYYGENDNKHSSDPARCHIRKQDEKNIYADIKKYDFPLEIAQEVNSSYLAVTKGQIRRGTFRKCIIFGCTFNAYKNQGNPQNPEELREKFELSKKEASRGLTFYNLNKNDKRKPVYISPVTFIPRIMQKFNAADVHIQRVTSLYNKVHNRSKLLNRSNPQSVIASLIYFYFRLIGGNISCAKFSKMVKLSDITISRIAKNISEILKTTDKVKLI